jgi:dolichol-phosphate mannosyltransferase
MITIVLPVLNEQENIEPLYNSLIKELNFIKINNFEIIFVDDGSDDNTAQIVKNICKIDLNVKLISLTKNFGHQIAIFVGLSKSRGDAIIVMDADFQHPIELIKIMYKEWLENKEIIVHGIKKINKTSWPRNLLTKLGYRFINFFSGAKIISGGSDFYLLDRKIVNRIIEIEEPRMMLRMFFSILGYRKKNIYFEPKNRLFGKSSYNILKLAHILRHSIVSTSVKPLRLLTLIGLITFVFAIILIIFEICNYIFVGSRPPGIPTIIILISFFGGINLLSVGILGEYIFHIMYDKLSKISFEIKETTNFSE